MVIKDIDLSTIELMDFARQINDDTVVMLAQSMESNGLLQPVLARAAPVLRGGVFVPGHRLIAGAHRVVAARRLGWLTIEARIIDQSITNIEAELIEIDENLCRAELTPAQRAAAIKRRKQIWDALHPSGGTNCPTGRKPDGTFGDGQQAFAAETAAVSGQPKRDINRHLARAEALGDDLEKVAGTCLDKGVELDALKTWPPGPRAELIALAQTGAKVTARRPAARLSMSIEYFTVEDGAVAIASQLIRRDRHLALALLDELRNQLGTVA